MYVVTSMPFFRRTRATFRSAEFGFFGVIVRTDLKGGGLGLLLMRKLIAYLRTQGTARLVATVLDENERMLKLARVLGFEEDPLGTSGDGTRDIVLALT